MKTTAQSEFANGTQSTITTEPGSASVDKVDYLSILCTGVESALQTYSNVHRGSGHNSIITTELYERARQIVLEYLALPKTEYVVIFSSMRRAEILKNQLDTGNYLCLSSQEFGLPLGVWAMAVKKVAMPMGAPSESGGGTTRLVSREWVVWSKAPDRFEAGTPAIINIIAFARALCLIRRYGTDIFRGKSGKRLSAGEILYHDELESLTGTKLLEKMRPQLIGHDLLVPSMSGIRPYINLDHAASTPTFRSIWETVKQTWSQSNELQDEIIEESRKVIAGFINAPFPEYDIVFTSGTTEAMNILAESASREFSHDDDPVVLISILEHSANDLPWRKATRNPLIRLNIDSDGFPDLNELETLLRTYNEEAKYGPKRIRIVSITGASNVLGIYNDLKEISRIVHRYGARLSVDGAQLVAHRKIDLTECGIDWFAFSAHKVYAPFGCGVLVARKGTLQFSNGEMAMINASGEENSGGIAGLAKALILLQRIGMDVIGTEEQNLTALAIRRMASVKGIRIYGPKDPNSTHMSQKGGIIPFDFKIIMSDKVGKELAVRGGIGIRYGCHCAHILVKYLVRLPQSLERMQGLIVRLFPKLQLPGVSRISFGLENTPDEVEEFIRILSTIVQKSDGNSTGTPFAISEKDAQRQMEEFTHTAIIKVYQI